MIYQHRYTSTGYLLCAIRAVNMIQVLARAHEVSLLIMLRSRALLNESPSVPAIENIVYFQSCAALRKGLKILVLMLGLN